MSTSEEAINEIQASEECLQFLTFTVKNELYGIDVNCVKELLSFNRITRIPDVPYFIRGVINLRGDVIPVIDLSARFYGENSAISKLSCIIITEVAIEEEKLVLGVLIDAVNKVLDIPVTEIEEAPTIGTKIRADFISKIGKDANRFIMILNMSKVLDIDELSIVSKQDTT